MQRSLFRKYLQMTTVIILVSFVFLGAIVTVFVTRYWNQERQDLLRHNAEGVANVTAISAREESKDHYIVNTEQVYNFVSAFSDNIDSFVIVTDIDGNIIMEHQGEEIATTYSQAEEVAETVAEDPNINSSSLQQDAVDYSTSTPQISKEIIDKVTDSSVYYSSGNLDGYFASDVNIVGVPVYTTNSAGVKTLIGTSFAASSDALFSGYKAEILKMFFLAAIAAVIVAFGITWLFSYRMTRPMKYMLEAIKGFGMGDFSVRVPVYSKDEVGELAVAFNQMAESLANSEMTNRNFIANVSHELKTPMTTISGFIDGIVDGTIPPEKQNYYLGIVSTEVKRLSRLVKTMLDISRIDSGKLTVHKSRFDISNTIFVTLLSFENRIDEKNINIEGLEDFEPTYIDGDPDMIHQVLYNLIENAVKFTDEGGTIFLGCNIAGGRITITIKNTGPGISPDDVKLIFERFFKTDKSRSKDKTGMGLGLYIVKTMIQLHGGEIRCESVENEYTIFEFWLPFTGEKRERRAPKKREKPGTVQVIETAEDVQPTHQQPKNMDVLDVTEYAVEPLPEDTDDRKKKSHR